MSKHKIFVSWSGRRANAVAVALKQWLTSLLQNVECFVSSSDIEAGERWFEKLAFVLEDYDFGIVVLDSDSVKSQWVHFEAGALAKRLERSRVVPLLCGLSPGDLWGSPLAQFQAVALDENGLRSLARAVNRGLEHSLSEENLNEAFDVWWDRKGRALCSMQQKEGVPPHQPTIKDIAVQLGRMEQHLSEVFYKVDHLSLDSLVEGLVRSVRQAAVGEALSSMQSMTDEKLRAMFKDMVRELRKHKYDFVPERMAEEYIAKNTRTKAEAAETLEDAKAVIRRTLAAG